MTTNNSLLVKLNKRLEEIQRWLSLTDEQTFKWKTLGKGFQFWLVDKLLASRGDIEKFSVRGNFPQLWKVFCAETGSNTEDTQRQRRMDNWQFGKFQQICC